MADSYQLQERGKSNNLTPPEVLQVNSNNHLPLDVASIDNVRRRLTQRHVQMYVQTVQNVFIIPRIYPSSMTG